MAGISDLIDALLKHPVQGGAVACWTAAISIIIYLAKRADDGKSVSSMTKFGLVASIIAAAISTAVIYLPGSSTHIDSVKTVHAAADRTPGYKLLKIAENDWKCARFDDLNIKYNLHDKKDLIERRATQGDPDFQYLAGMLNTPGGLTDGAEDNPEKRLAYLTASAKANDARGLIALALIFAQNGDTSKALAYAQRAEDQKFPFAGLFLGQFYDGSGSGRIVPDAERAARYYQDAIERGCLGLPSQKLAFMYLGEEIGKSRGEPSVYLPLDRARGFYLLKQAANASYADRYLALSTLISLLLKDRQFTEASEYADIAATVCPDVCARDIADSYYRNGQKQEALVAYKRLAKAAAEFYEPADKRYAEQRIFELTN